MTNYQKHFERELEIMRKSVEQDDELIIEPYVEAINNLLDIFGKQGHSGSSASLHSAVLSKTIKALTDFQILSPLTGEDDEWNDITFYHGEKHNPKKPKLYQNKRDSGVFKNEDGTCNYVTAIVFQGEDRWDRFTGSVAGIGSSQKIKEFPFMPKTFFLDVYREPYDANNPKHQNSQDVISCQSGDMVYFIKDEKQLETIFEYYDKLEMKKSKSRNNESYQNSSPTESIQETDGQTSVDPVSNGGEKI